MNQKQLSETFGPLFTTECVKRGKVFARRALPGEYVETITGDGKETESIAKEGDWVIMNDTQANEKYIHPNFLEKYEYLGPSHIEGLDIYIPKNAKRMCVEMTQEIFNWLGIDENEFKIVPAWGGEMVVKVNDFLVSANGKTDIYRIARKEFFETYEILK